MCPLIALFQYHGAGVNAWIGEGKKEVLTGKTSGALFFFLGI